MNIFNYLNKKIFFIFLHKVFIEFYYYNGIMVDSVIYSIGNKL